LEGTNHDLRQFEGQGRIYGKPSENYTHSRIASPRPGIRTKAKRTRGAGTYHERVAPWPYGIDSRGGKAREARGGVDFRQSNTICPARGFRQLSAQLCHRCESSARGQSRSRLGTIGGNHVSERLCDTTSAGRTGQSRPGGRVSPALFWRRCNSGRQTI